MVETTTKQILSERRAWTQYIRAAWNQEKHQAEDDDRVDCWLNLSNGEKKRGRTLLFTFTRLIKRRALQENLDVASAWEIIVHQNQNDRIPEWLDLDQDEVMEVFFTTWEKARILGNPLIEAEAIAANISIPEEILVWIYTPGYKRFVQFVLALFKTVGKNSVALPQVAIAERLKTRQATVSTYIRWAKGNGWLKQTKKFVPKRRAATYKLKSGLFEEFLWNL